MKPWKSPLIIEPLRRRHWLAWLGVVALGLLVFAACSQAPSGGAPPAGIAVDPQFAAFVAENGAERVFGEPLTTLYREQATGRDVQYFTRMRLEVGPDQTVQVAPLGAWALTGLAPINDGTTPPLVDETFADFYAAYGGLDLFGPPLSPQLQEGDLWVQYFQNARLEWHPELSPAFRIQVGPLGTAHFYGTSAVAEYEAQRKVEAVNLRAVEAEDLAIDASLSAPILFQGDEQIVYAIVTTADGSRTVADAAVVALIAGETIPLGRTEADGTLAAPLPLAPLTPGDRIDLEVQVLSDSGAVLGRVILTFSAWW